MALLPPVSVSQRKQGVGTCLGKIALPAEVIYEAEVTKRNNGLSFWGSLKIGWSATSAAVCTPPGLERLSIC